MAGSSSTSSTSQPSRFASKLRAIDRMSPANVKHNNEVVFFVRTFVSIIGGCCCGILGLTNWSGFAFYAIIALMTAAVLAAKLGTSDVQQYFPSWNVITVDGLIGGLLSYVLFWTLLYDIVYVY